MASIATPAQQEAIERAIAVLNAAGIDAKLAEHWRGGELQLVIVLRNLSGIEYPDGY